MSGYLIFTSIPRVVNGPPGFWGVTLAGLRYEFEAVIVNLTSFDSITLQEVQFMLQTHDMRLENLNASKMLELSNSIANFAKKVTPLSLPFRGNHNHSRGIYKRDRGHYITGGGRG